MRCVLGHDEKQDSCPACQVIKQRETNPFCRNVLWCSLNKKCESIVKYDRACND